MLGMLALVQRTIDYILGSSGFRSISRAASNPDPDEDTPAPDPGPKFFHRHCEHYGALLTFAK